MMKGQKGITLVALIITIIVMLILVGVSISIALNGGIFEKARTASEDTLKAQLKEAIALAKADVLMYYYENGANDAAETAALAKFKPEDYLDSNWKDKTYTAAFDSDFTVTFTNGGNTYTETVNIASSTRTTEENS